MSSSFHIKFFTRQTFKVSFFSNCSCFSFPLELIWRNVKCYNFSCFSFLWPTLNFLIFVNKTVFRNTWKYIILYLFNRDRCCRFKLLCALKIMKNSKQANSFYSLWDTKICKQNLFTLINCWDNAVCLHFPETHEIA